MKIKNYSIQIILILSVIALPFLMGAASGQLGLAPTVREAVRLDTIPTCLNRINIPESELHWIYVPQSADELYSDDTLMWLAGQLIKNKVINASNCPAGGLGSEGYANACGMSLSKAKVIEIQNSLNQPIMDAWVNVGVPPVLLKQVIRYESQFWPSRENEYHYGFGHVTPIGILNAMEWDPALLKLACGSNSATCSLDSVTAGAILDQMIVTCPTCPNGIDDQRAAASVNLLAHVLMGYCNQSAQLVFNASGWRSNLVVDYPTIWKITLMNYNAGSVCVEATLNETFKATQGPMKWSDILAHLQGDNCKRGAYYANQITAKAYPFPPQQ
jgi:hypothetical protein